MQRLLHLHQQAGRLGLRLLYLQLLWIGHTLRGGILLGAFPATAAAHAVLREHERDGLHQDLPSWRTTRTSFGAHWHRELWPANRLGAALVTIWAVLLASRAVVENLDLGTPTPLLAGTHTILGITLGLATAIVWPLQAHFNDSTPALLRRALILLLGRPGTTLLTGAGVGLILSAYYLLPGLIPVFGTTAPAAITTACLWHTGILAAGPADRPTVRLPSAT